MDAHLQDPTAEHTVQPGMVYISNPTELGTIYSLAELTAIREVTQRYGLILFVDGARLGSALGAEENDITLVDLARLSDAFYLGGTKMGRFTFEGSQRLG
jgi:threonine aldolase